MHTTHQIQFEEFQFTLAHEITSFDQIFPEFNASDRVGVVVRQPSGAIGASALLMASIAKFYDFHRDRLGNKPGQLRIYPDY